jgi:hypothetical protein
MKVGFVEEDMDNMLEVTEKDVRVDGKLLTDVYIALVKGTLFIAGISGNNFSDFIDVCQRVGIVKYLFNRKMNLFLKENRIEPLLVAESENIDGFFSRHKTRIDKYLTYIETFIDGKKPEPRTRNAIKADGILTYCPACGHEFSCFIMFADEFLPFFKLDDSAKGTTIELIIRDNYTNVKRRIEKILDFYYISDEEKGLYGWSHTLAPESKKYDAYSSVHVMDYILTNKIETGLIKSSNKKFISRIAMSIITNQIRENRIELHLKGVSRDIHGAWTNIYWEHEIGQIDITIDILKILNKYKENYTKEVQELFEDTKTEVKNFVEKAFVEDIEFYNCPYPRSATGWHPFVMDFPPHEDWFNVRISDVTGTIAALQGLLMFEGYNSTSPKVIQIVKWLINIQTKQGAWPVLSELCIQEADSAQSEGYCFMEDKEKNPLRDSDGGLSLSNTARALQALNEWLDGLFPADQNKVDPEIEKIETYLRNFISNKMEFVYGQQWWKQVPEAIRNEVEARTEKDKTEGRQLSRTIDYVYIMDYATIMCSGNNYLKVFKAYFPNLDTLRFHINELNKLRNKSFHQHKLPENYEDERNVHISRLKDLTEKKKINSSWRKGLASLILQYGDKEETIQEWPAIEIVQRLIDIRNAAKENKDFEKADKIRTDLEKLFIKVLDKGGKESSWEMIP